MALILTFEMALMLTAATASVPRDSYALVGGAVVVIALVLFGMAYPNSRQGQAAIEANHRFYLSVLACELPVLALGLISFRYFKYPFWLGWAVNVGFTLRLIAVLVWLEFFWHW